MSLANVLRFVTSHPLNAHDRTGALIDFARWQLASRLLDQEFIFEWVNGARFKVRRGQTGLTGNIYAGLHEFEDMAFLLHYLRPADLFVDVGANVGSYTILASAAVGARCVTVEPVPATFADLVDNVRLNRVEDRVRCLNVGISNAPGTIRFTDDGDTVNHVATAAEGGVNVPVQRLDDALQGAAPTLIKIDVEGYESPVVEGASATLAGSSPLAVIMELNGSGSRYGFKEEAILERMLAWGFVPHRYHPFERKLERLESKNLSSGNTVFVRGADFAAERITSAPAFHVRGRQL